MVTASPIQMSISVITGISNPPLVGQQLRLEEPTSDKAIHCPEVQKLTTRSHHIEDPYRYMMENGEKVLVNDHGHWKPRSAREGIAQIHHGILQIVTLRKPRETQKGCMSRNNRGQGTAVGYVPM